MDHPDKIEVAITRLAGNDLALPSYHTLGSVGMDLRAAVSDPVVIELGHRKLVPCGVAIALPPGYEAQLRPRSGLALRHGVTLLNSPGTIDNDYRGELAVILINHGREPFVVQRGERVAQLVIAPVARARWREVSELGNSERGTGGFGHTGTN